MALLIAVAGIELAVSLSGGSSHPAISVAPTLRQIDVQVVSDYLHPTGARERPQTVALGRANASSAIPGSVLIAANAVGGSPFRYTGIAAMKLGSSVYSVYRYPADSVTSSITTGLSYRIEFAASTDELEVATVGNGTAMHIRVDGQVVGKFKLPLDGSAHLILLDWRNAGPSKPRRILIECSNGAAFGGVRIPSMQRITPPAEPLGPRMIVVGDSWTDGTGSDGIYDHAYVAGQLLGIRDTWVAGIGGTGYLQDSVQGSHVGARVGNDIIDHHPDIVVFCYGSDDVNFAPAQIARSARVAWSEVHAALPHARIIVEGPWPAVGANIGAAEKYGAIDEALLAAAKSLGLPYVSPVEGAWIKGSGYVGHQNGTGSSDTLIGPDGIHPSPVGHVYIGHLEASAWRPFLGAFFPKP